MHRKEKIYFYLILVLSFILRFWGLGYSDFYGDETKLLYWNKTIPAFQFFLDQRKGPVQFLAVWFIEKFTGGFNEFFVRLPFALAGFLSLILFYFIVKKLFDYKTALISTLFFSINGFNVAFSRTAQYQSLLIFFGFLSILLALLYFESKKKYFLTVSGLFLGLAFLAHYDAVFYLIPLLYLFLLKKKLDLKSMFYFLIPLIFLGALFYIPYLYKGYFLQNTINYIARRFSGCDFVVNSSLHTFLLYNPCYLFFLPLLLGLLFLVVEPLKQNIKIVFLWFFIPFLCFQFIFLNPGTHIMHYFVPLYILTGSFLLYLYDKIKSPFLKHIYIVIVAGIVSFQLFTSLFIFIPFFKTGYPWEKHTGFPAFDRNYTKYHLFIYGFPYNRNWHEIAEFFKETQGVRNIYTNDNDTIAEYYLKEYDYTPPGVNYIPQYYIHIYDGQEFLEINQEFYTEFLTKYELVKQFFNNYKLTAEVYRLKDY